MRTSFKTQSKAQEQTNKPTRFSPQTREQQTLSTNLVQRLESEPESLSPAEMMQLQRAIGNQNLQRHLGITNPSPAESFAAFRERVSFPVQAKLTVTPAGDKYEQEADAVANQAIQAMRVQRQPEDEDMMLQRQPEDDEMMLQRYPDFTGGGDVSTDIESQIQTARGGGRTLPDNVRAPMESAIGADFSNVRVHTSTASDSLNRSVQAKAFTTGSDIFFSQGTYNPHNESGQKLLAHELTHVVQQGAAEQVQRKKK